ncbi:hypothetical protein [Salinarimonas soli]|uniref:Uncharacterized protein n=1 Tax=Salinarimonas soli TaxID=1638099 RepID=A0A5B2W258_9HYPH|nr:hypothetical protein [Salinarimonas soli]KAA2244319.1 hypothetical protein F0L46_00015 [Salinarimonas soli]
MQDHWLERIRLAVRVRWANTSRARMVLEALRHLTPHAGSPERWDALVELQLAAFGLHDVPDGEPGTEALVHRFAAAWLAFNETWSTAMAGDDELAADT